MKTQIINLFLFVLLAPLFGMQQSPSPLLPVATQVTPSPSQVVPCIKAAPAPPHKPNWLETKARSLACANNKNLCDLPKSSSDILGTNPDAKPCPPTTIASLQTAQPAPSMHLPAGVTTIWLCNPIVISTDPSHTTTFITPDALTIAEPAQASAFEADGAKADAKAAVSCANLRRNPKTNKVFLAQ